MPILEYLTSNNLHLFFPYNKWTITKAISNCSDHRTIKVVGIQLHNNDSYVCLNEKST